MQVPILNGVYTDEGPDFRTTYPRNYQPVPKATGIASGYLKPAEGIVQNGSGPGTSRGGINWNGTLYRVMGTLLCSVGADGTVTVLADVGGSGQVRMTYGFDRLAIMSSGNLFYWNGTTLTQVTDPDLGTIIDVHWIAGYFMFTDGTYIGVTELNAPTSINPLKYGSAEENPDPIFATDELRNEMYAFGRYTVEVFRNIGGSNFPFQRIEGALVPKGCIGTNMYCSLGNTFAFVGSGPGEAPAVYILVPGDTAKISTREIDVILEGYSEVTLAACTMDVRVFKNHQLIYIHLPDQTLVYDTQASESVQEPVWFTVDSGMLTPLAYRGRDIVWCYDQWNVADVSSSAVGVLSEDVGSHYGDAIGWQFGTLALYNGGNSAVIHEMELVTLPGRCALGADPTVWTSYSLDGREWSQERGKSAGKQGKRRKRLVWRGQGEFQNARMQRFRGTSDACLVMARLEMQIEQLFTRPGVPSG